MREYFNIRGSRSQNPKPNFFHTITLTPGFFGTVNLCNRNFPFPDSVPDTVTAGLYVRNVLIVLTDHIFMHIAIVVYAIASAVFSYLSFPFR